MHSIYIAALIFNVKEELSIQFHKNQRYKGCRQGFLQCYTANLANYSKGTKIQVPTEADVVA
jgi:hypothetical protein